MMQQSIRMVQPELQFIDNGFLFGKLVFILFPVSLPGLPETFDCGSQRGNLLPAEFQLVSEPEIFPGKPFALAEFSGRKTAPSGALENANPDAGKQQSGFAETP